MVSVRWLKNGQTIALDERIRSSNTALTLEDVTREDGGMYQCIATNGDEEAQGTAELTLGGKWRIRKVSVLKLTTKCRVYCYYF